MAEYDKIYQDNNYFGNPYPELLDYFKGLNNELRILDMGCGQGRDTLALGRLGFRVTGIDVSAVGIAQLNEIALREGINANGVVADFNRFPFIDQYDVILLDSILHFYKRDKEHELGFLKRLLEQLKPGGRLVNVMQKNASRVRLLKETIDNAPSQFEYEREISFIYREFNSEFHMISILKQK